MKTKSQRRGRGAKMPKAAEFKQAGFRQLRNPYPPIEVLSGEAVEEIHRASLKILDEIGLEFVSDKARGLLVKNGCRVDAATGYVLMPGEVVMEWVGKAPREFKMHARNAKYDSVYGGNNINFSVVSSAPNSSDIEKGRRAGNFADYCDFLKLGQIFNCFQTLAGYPVEPTDLPVATRHLDAYLAFIILTEKPWHAYSLGGGRIEDALEMICIARGIDKQRLADEPSVMTVVNTNSPLKVDVPMAEGAMLMAGYGQPVVVTPFTLAGAMAPVTLAGALAQQNAEALGVIALIQMAAPGAPVMYGGFTSNVDMKSGAPAFGTPEYAKAVFAGGQLARRYGIPYRTSNVNAANCVDAQAAWESAMSLWASVFSYGNLVKHSGGWLEGGLCASFEKLIVDAEMVQMMYEMLQPIKISDDELGLGAIGEVGAGGHFFGTAHTLARYENAFYAPILADWSNFETWTERGGKRADERAHGLYKKLLSEYEAPHLDEDKRAGLDEFVKKRRREIGG